ncbi:MAG: hypothetical protein Q4A21_03540 [bacterium]|nr:hypothetical protein [bacterium]
MDFERENNLEQTPQITGLPDDNFVLPKETPYMAQTDMERVDPSEAPAFHQIQPQEDVEETEIVNWQAQDLLIGEKSQTWYIYFFIIVVAMIAAAWFLMGGWQSWSFILVIVISAAAIVMTRSTKHSKIINYALSTRGVYIGNDFYEYANFKAFGILKEKQIYSIILMPRKRFSPSVSIYFPKENGEKITDILGARLPMEEIHLDLIDRIIRKINL